METLGHNIFLFVGALLFSCGIITVLTKKNAIMMLIGVELMLNAANINLVFFSRFDPGLQGQMMALFIMVVAAAEAAVGLAIFLKVFQHFKTADPDMAGTMKN